MQETPPQDRGRQPLRSPGAAAGLLSPQSGRSPAPGRRHRTPKSSESQLPLFWRLFGAALLSIAALVTITLTQQFSGILTEVRQDLNRLHESRGERARKDEVEAAFKDLQAVANGLAALRERSLLLEEQLKAAEQERKQLPRELHEVRERLAEAVGRQGAPAPADAQGEPRVVPLRLVPSPPSGPDAP